MLSTMATTFCHNNSNREDEQQNKALTLTRTEAAEVHGKATVGGVHVIYEEEDDANSRDSGISLSDPFEILDVQPVPDESVLPAPEPASHKPDEVVPLQETKEEEEEEEEEKRLTAAGLTSPVGKEKEGELPEAKGELETTREEYITSKEDSFVTHQFALEVVERPQIHSTAFKSISHSVLASLMRELGAEEFKKHFVLIDCRYPYEYHGVHIKTAVNLYHQEEKDELVARLTAFFFPEDPLEAQAMKRRIPIFYCEYSSKRGPRTAHLLRDIDRRINEGFYPYVDYPQLCLLDRGFKPLFESPHNFKDICATSNGGPIPEKYVTEHSMEHIEAKKEHKTMVKTQSLMRSSSSQCSTSRHEIVKRYCKRLPRRNITTPISGRPLLSSKRLSSDSSNADESHEHLFRKRALTTTDDTPEDSNAESPPPAKMDMTRRWLRFDISSADNSVEEEFTKFA
ncbi:hypothetical protein WR25_23498 [Diploscapter pachys]|uniref:protein-tyrosine-phosphatase n=1 Tax=Diploscapter pachys TaxID=2018661 RepID=A0A2A2KE87_9BILA|nr:hypothetical protein WR25_23498 [Diploscapter pachys]